MLGKIKRKKRFVLKAKYRPLGYFKAVYGGTVFVGRLPHPVTPIWQSFIFAGSQTGESYHLFVSAHRNREDSEKAVERIEKAIMRYGNSADAVMEQFWDEVEAIRTSGDLLPEGLPEGTNANTTPSWLKDPNEGLGPAL